MCMIIINILKNTIQSSKQTAYSHSWDIDFKDFMNLYKKCSAKPYSFSVIDATLASDNPSCFKKNILKRV